MWVKKGCDPEPHSGQIRCRWVGILDIQHFRRGVAWLREDECRWRYPNTQACVIGDSAYSIRVKRIGLPDRSEGTPSHAVKHLQTVCNFCWIFGYVFVFPDVVCCWYAKSIQCIGWRSWYDKLICRSRAGVLLSGKPEIQVGSWACHSW